MNCRKRKLTDSNDVSLKRMKHDFGNGGALKRELLIFAKEECDAYINWDIATVIFQFSLGWWETCIHCGESTDPHFSNISWKLEPTVVIVYHCKECEEEIRDQTSKAVLKYPFVDDELI